MTLRTILVIAVVFGVACDDGEDDCADGPCNARCLAADLGGGHCSGGSCVCESSDACQDGPCNARCLSAGHVAGGYCDGQACRCVEGADGDTDVDVDVDADSDACTPTCTGRECGSNGCGGTCGRCDPGEECDDLGACRCSPDPETDVVATRLMASGALSTSGGTFFPTYLSHLIGSTTFAGGAWNFAEVDVQNRSSCATHRVEATAHLEGFSTPAERLRSLAPGESVTFLLNPVFDRGALTALSASTPGQAAIALEVDGYPVVHDALPVTVLPRNSVIWGLNVAGHDDEELSAVLVTRPGSRLDRVVGEAAVASMWGLLYGYSSPSSHSETFVLAAGGHRRWVSYLEPGERLSGRVESVSGGTAPDVDVFVMDHANFTTWSSGGTASACFVGDDLVAGGAFSCTPAAGGWYYTVFQSDATWFDRSVVVSRYISREEVVREHLESLFGVLHARGMSYTSVASDFFLNLQNVRLPEDSLSADTANCLDGTLLFASALESLGMQPLLFYVPGHAFVGVWSGDDRAPDRVAWALETTMISGGDFWAAYTRGLEQVAEHVALGDLRAIDVQDARAAGILPMP